MGYKSHVVKFPQVSLIEYAHILWYNVQCTHTAIAHVCISMQTKTFNSIHQSKKKGSERQSKTKF